MQQLSKFKKTDVREIPIGWKSVSIKEFTKEHKQGFYTNKSYTNQGIKLVRITDLLNPRISYETMPCLNLDEKTINDFKISKGDFLIARSGAIGRFGIVKDNTPCVFGSYIIRFVFDSQILDNDFFGYLFQTDTIRKQLANIQHGSSNININAENIKSIKVLIPSLKEQQKIASILSKVDGLIQKTDQVIKQTQRLKKGLIQRLLTKGIGHTKFEKTELGEIPEDWIILKLEDVCSIRENDDNIKSELYIGLEHIGQGNNQLILKGNIKDFTSNKNAFLKGDVL
jgi:type I restriction enzyme, S subunit